jgi:uncharacterized protein (DUF1778 family)
LADTLGARSVTPTQAARSQDSANELTALAEKAEQVFSRFEALRLSERDFQRFVRAINTPPRPAAKLRKAAVEYKRLRAREPESHW